MNPSTPIPMTCEHCEKPTELCICSSLNQPMRTRLRVLLLQHPQEPDKELGSARMTQLQLEQARLAVGLSWPNLSRAWAGKGNPVTEELQPKDWLCIYLGNAGDLKKKIGPQVLDTLPAGGGELLVVDKKGNPLPDQRKAREGLKGIILLDGTWSQAKTLWWRNAWLLKCRRAALLPKQPSLYGNMRKEPRRECLSTLESTALSLRALGESTETTEKLRASFQTLLDRARDLRNLKKARPEQKAKES